MASAALLRKPASERLPILLDGIPIMYEDDYEGDMGETNQHVSTDMILHVGLQAHLASRPEYRVFSNMNLYYYPRRAKRKTPYCSPDVMVVEPSHELGEFVASYWIGEDGPAPLLTVEILSARSFQQQDLGKKPKIYARLGIPEYILIDVSGEFLPDKLTIRKLRGDRTWRDERDADGGVTSVLGFRLTVEQDGKLRVWNTKTGERYLRPFEAHLAERARRQAEERAQRLEAELARLRKPRRKRKS